MSQDSPKLDPPKKPVPKKRRPPPPPPPADAPGTGGRADGTIPAISVAAGARHRLARAIVRSTAGFLVSLIVHLALLLTMALLVVLAPTASPLTVIVTSDTGEDELVRQADTVQVTMPDVRDVMGSELQRPLLADVSTAPPALDAADRTIRPYAPNRSDVFDSANSMLVPNDAPRGGGFEGRRPDRRGAMVADGGGNAASESAVALALAWLAVHQRRDGSWRFDFDGEPCNDQCGNPGTVGATNAATGLALLPFLGAGHTHMEGEYRDVVHRGLYYLKDAMVMTPDGGDLHQQTMYAQGIATIALCEAVAMSDDETFRLAAQRAIDFIGNAQHSKGGWRYLPRHPGDTTVFGWQMMALKSAHMAGLDVPSPTISLAERFLDSVQSGDGAYYGYMTPDESPGPTAIGLLIRMYTGWRHDVTPLAKGVAYLAKKGPSESDMYFNYYATQVLHHYGGQAWPKWNEQLRDYLIRTQAAAGHERGSWFFVDKHGSKGGRLYTTAMCAMILEVYYRHMPLYRRYAVEENM